MLKAHTLTTMLCLLLVVAIAAPALGQDVVTITSGRVMFANNDTIIVNVHEGSHPGMHKFSVKDAEAADVKFLDRNGNEIQFADMRRGQEITSVRVHHPAEARVTMTQTEVDEFVEGNVIGVEEVAVTEEVVYEDGKAVEDTVVAEAVVLEAVDEEAVIEEAMVEEAMAVEEIEEAVLEEMAEMLPSTASPLPLVGLAALLLLGLAATLAGLRRALR